MGTEVAMFGGSKLPAFARNREPSEIAKNLMGNAQGSDRISIKGGTFRLVIGGKEVAQIEERYLDVVIVKAAPKVNRVWYAGKYDPEKQAAPDCWSADGEVPSPDAANIQADRCADCEKNIKGSGEGDSRACRYQQRIAVVLAHGKLIEDEDGNATLNHGSHGPLQLTVPAASLFGKAEGDNRPLQEYARYVVAQKADPSMLVTRLRFDTSAESPKLFFKPMRWVTDEEFEQVEAFAASAEATAAVEVSFGKPEPEAAPVEGTRPKSKAKTAEDEDAPAKPAAKKKAAPAPAPAPAGDDDDDAPAPAPAPKKKAAPAPAPASDDDDDDAPAPAPAPKKKAAPAPAPAADDDEDAPVTKRKGDAPAVTGAKKSAADLVNDWGDD